MNVLLIFIIISISLFSSISNYEIGDSLYSLLLDKVRKDLVKSSLLNLPERQSVDMLKMIISMTNQKIRNNLTDIESAFLIYMWIGQNIQINCYKKYIKDESALNVYNSGIGGVIGISSLFNIMCSYMKIQSDSIEGFTKMKNYIRYETHTTTEHMWNYIIIDNNTYLIDSSLASGFCCDESFYKEYTNLYFGIKPEILIKMNFPKDEQFQLTNKNITKYNWEHIEYMDRYFYIYGLINIKPQSLYLYPGKEDKITIQYDTSNSDIGLVGQMYYNDRYGEMLIFNKVTYNKGIAEISLKNWNNFYNVPIRFEIYVGTRRSPWEQLCAVYSTQT